MKRRNLLFGGSGYHLRLYLLVHVERHLGATAQNSLVIKQSAHVGIQLHGGLTVFSHVFGEVFRDVNQAVGVATVDHSLGFLHVLAMRYYLHVGRGIDTARELAAELRMAVVDDHGRHLAHALMIVKICVKKRVKQRHYDEEDDHAFVEQRALHLIRPDFYCIS